MHDQTDFSIEKLLVIQDYVFIILGMICSDCFWWSTKSEKVAGNETCGLYVFWDFCINLRSALELEGHPPIGVDGRHVNNGQPELFVKKDHRNSIRITVVLCWSRGELNSPKIIFSRWFWNIWTVSVRNGESRIHAVDGETACQRAVKRRFFRFGYKLATWSQSLEGL